MMKSLASAEVLSEIRLRLRSVQVNDQAALGEDDGEADGAASALLV